MTDSPCIILHAASQKGLARIKPTIPFIYRIADGYLALVQATFQHTLVLVTSTFSRLLRS